MKRLAIFVALASLVVPAFAQVDKKVEKEIRADYVRMVTAMKKKDVNGVLGMMTPDATMKEMGRTMTRKEFEPMLKQQIQMLNVTSADIKFSKIAAKGDMADTVYVETIKGSMKTPDGKTATMEQVAKNKTSFKKVGGHWKMKDSETIGTPAIKINGKPFPAGGPGPGAPK